MTTLDKGAEITGVTRLMRHESDVKPEIDIINDLKSTLECIMNQGGALSPQAQKLVEKIQIQLENLGLSKAEVLEIGTQ